MTEHKEKTLEDVVALAKRRGFIYQGAEIYGGLSGTWDYGPLGTELRFNIEQLWWKQFVSGRDDMFGISSSLIMPESVWRASGHLDGFTDPLVECEKCKRRFRADHLEDKEKCPHCGGVLGKEKVFNLLFPLEMGSAVGGTSTAYLRGEVAQGMFVNFKNIVDSFHPDLPFGIAQIGKAFRNEINPRDFLFRVREFDLAEFEYFIRENSWEEHFSYWQQEMWRWIDQIGLSRERVHEYEVPASDRAHYSKRTIDFEYEYPFGKKELYGLAYRTDFDLKRHMEASGVDLSFVEKDGSKYIPHTIEPTFGIGRTVLAVLCESYCEDELGGESRIVLKLPPRIAPIKVAVFPLLKNKPELVKKAKEVYHLLRKELNGVVFDDHGNIGKRYRRQDEIGTPFCITVDFDSLSGEDATIRYRDSGKQDRIPLGSLMTFLKDHLA